MVQSRIQTAQRGGTSGATMRIVPSQMPPIPAMSMQGSATSKPKYLWGVYEYDTSRALPTGEGVNVDARVHGGIKSKEEAEKWLEVYRKTSPGTPYSVSKYQVGEPRETIRSYRGGYAEESKRAARKVRLAQQEQREKVIEKDSSKLYFKSRKDYKEYKKAEIKKRVGETQKKMANLRTAIGVAKSTFKKSPDVTKTVIDIGDVSYTIQQPEWSMGPVDKSEIKQTPITPSDTKKYKEKLKVEMESERYTPKPIGYYDVVGSKEVVGTYTTQKRVKEPRQTLYGKIVDWKLAGEEKGIRKWELEHLPSWFVGEKLTKENIDKTMFGQVIRPYLDSPVKVVEPVAIGYTAAKIGGYALGRGGVTGTLFGLTAGGLFGSYVGTTSSRLQEAKQESKSQLATESAKAVVDFSLFSLGTRIGKAEPSKYFEAKKYEYEINKGTEKPTFDIYSDIYPAEYKMLESPKALKIYQKPIKDNLVVFEPYKASYPELFDPLLKAKKAKSKAESKDLMIEFEFGEIKGAKIKQVSDTEMGVTKRKTQIRPKIDYFIEDPVNLRQAKIFDVTGKYSKTTKATYVQAGKSPQLVKPIETKSSRFIDIKTSARPEQLFKIGEKATDLGVFKELSGEPLSPKAFEYYDLGGKALKKITTKQEAEIYFEPPDLLQLDKAAYKKLGYEKPYMRKEFEVPFSNDLVVQRSKYPGTDWFSYRPNIEEIQTKIPGVSYRRGLLPYERVSKPRPYLIVKKPDIVKPISIIDIAQTQGKPFGFGKLTSLEQSAIIKTLGTPKARYQKVGGKIIDTFSGKVIFEVFEKSLYGKSKRATKQEIKTKKTTDERIIKDTGGGLVTELLPPKSKSKIRARILTESKQKYGEAKAKTKSKTSNRQRRGLFFINKMKVYPKAKPRLIPRTFIAPGFKSDAFSGNRFRWLNNVIQAQKIKQGLFFRTKQQPRLIQENKINEKLHPITGLTLKPKLDLETPFDLKINTKQIPQEPIITEIIPRRKPPKEPLQPTYPKQNYDFFNLKKKQGRGFGYYYKEYGVLDIL